MEWNRSNLWLVPGQELNHTPLTADILTSVCPLDNNSWQINAGGQWNLSVGWHICSGINCKKTGLIFEYRNQSETLPPLVERLSAVLIAVASFTNQMEIQSLFWMQSVCNWALKWTAGCPPPSLVQGLASISAITFFVWGDVWVLVTKLFLIHNFKSGPNSVSCSHRTSGAIGK